MFDCAVTKIDFGRIYFIKLILIKNKLKVKWFIFGYIYSKNDLYKKWTSTAKLDSKAINENLFYKIITNVSFFTKPGWLYEDTLVIF